MADRTIDLLDPETHSGDPWPLYDWLRDEAPVYWDPINELWCISRYDDIVAIARDPGTFSSAEGNVPKLPPDGEFMHMDGKPHLERRSLIRDYFGPQHIRKLEEHIRDVCAELIDNVAASGSCEFVEDIAAPLPMRIIGEMCGIPVELHDEVRHHLDVFGTGGNGPMHVTDEVNDHFYAWAAIHFDLVEQRRAEPKDDLLSIWVHTHDLEHSEYDEESLLFEHTMMMFGGSETTRNVITGGLYELIKHPDQLEWLREHPEGAANAAEEMIRWVTPFVRMSRTVEKDVEFRGQAMKEGQELIMLWPAANRQPDKFPDPHSFDIRREFKNASLSFGYGPHFCLGARLARSETRILIEELMKRLDDLHLTGEPTWARSSFIRGILELPLGFTARAEAALASK